MAIRKWQGSLFAELDRFDTEEDRSRAFRKAQSSARVIWWSIALALASLPLLILAKFWLQGLGLDWADMLVTGVWAGTMPPLVFLVLARRVRRALRRELVARGAGHLPALRLRHAELAREPLPGMGKEFEPIPMKP